MTDRELLELAAKAAGVQGLHYESGAGLFIGYASSTALYWNPLDSDADAFRLEVVAEIVSGPGVGNRQWATWHAAGKTFFESNERPDGTANARAARRRAIVRAAAARGKAMP